MSEQLDDELSKRISDVFDLHEEDASAADEGWLLLREKFPEKAERRIVGAWFWRSMAAAVLLLLCLTGLWLQKRSVETTQLAGKPSLKTPVQKPSSNTQTTSPSSQKALPDASVNQPTVTKNPSNLTQPENKSGWPAGNYAHVQKQEVQPVGKMQHRIQPKLNRLPASISDPAVNYAVNKPTTSLKEPLASDIDNKLNTPLVHNKPVGGSIALGQSATDSAVNTTNAILAQQQTVPVVNQKDSVKSLVKRPSMNELFAQEKAGQSNKQKQDNKKNIDKKIIYSVYAATYLNYAKGSSTQPNIGAGFTSDIRLTGKLKLSTGVAIAQNKLNYSGEPTQANILSDAIRASNVVERTYDAAPALSTGFATRPVVPAVTVKSYNVSLTGLDVPINIKYEFNPKKTDSYIAAGLSSSTFINETYRYKYDNSTNVNALGASAANLPDATSSTAFSRFDFARTLNLAVGLGLQLGKSNRLVVEPFVKYPLDGLGSQQIRFGAGGVNLKLKFQKAKK